MATYQETLINTVELFRKGLTSKINDAINDFEKILSAGYDSIKSLTDMYN